MTYEQKIIAAMELIKADKIKAARNELDRLSKEYPLQIEPFYYLGKIEATNNNIIKAIEYVQKALKIMPFYQGYISLAEFTALLKIKKIQLTI